MNTFGIILTIFPIVLNAVKAVEEAISLPGAGKQKLDLVLDAVAQAYEASGDLSHGISWEKLSAQIVLMVANIVRVHNKLGLFNTTAPSKA